MFKKKKKYAFDKMSKNDPGYIAAFIDKASSYLEYDIDDCWIGDMLDELLPKHPNNIELLKLEVSLQHAAGMVCNTLNACQKICTVEPTFVHKFNLIDAMVQSVELEVHMLELAAKNNQETPQDIDIVASIKLIEQSLKIAEELTKKPEYSSWRVLIEECVDNANIAHSTLSAK